MLPSTLLETSSTLLTEEECMATDVIFKLFELFDALVVMVLGSTSRKQ